VAFHSAYCVLPSLFAISGKPYSTVALAEVTVLHSTIDHYHAAYCSVSGWKSWASEYARAALEAAANETVLTEE